MPNASREVPEEQSGMRADSAISAMFDISRSKAQEILAFGGAVAARRTLRKSDRVTVGEVIELWWEEAKPLHVEARDFAKLRIVSEDEHLAVIDKPAGVAAHPAVGWDGPTVVGVLAARGVQLADAGPAERKGIVHRLDAGTSGLMVVAKSLLAYTALKDAFRNRTVDKTYNALVQGHPDPLRGTIDAPIGRHPKTEFKFAVVSGGKHSITHYETLEAFAYASLVEVQLETGRTHQIRVHFAAQHHPLLGDTMYGADPTLAKRCGLQRQWLHAVGLAFEHPATGERVSFSSEYTADLQHALDVLSYAVPGTP